MIWRTYKRVVILSMAVSQKNIEKKSIPEFNNCVVGVYSFTIGLLGFVSAFSSFRTLVIV